MTKLESLLMYVTEHNEFYKNRILDYGIKNPLDITQWPVLTRKELQKNRYNMFSEGYKTKYFNQQLKRQSSSGSTGIPVNVYWDYREWYASNLSLWRVRSKMYGIKPSDKVVTFTMASIDIHNISENVNYLQSDTNIMTFNTSLITNDKSYSEIIKIINEFNPKWIYVQPYVLSKIIKAYQDARCSPPRDLKYIESVGEVLFPDLREKTKMILNVFPTNMYGSEETNGIAIEDNYGTMRILKDNVYVEVMKSGRINQFGSGKTIITNLNNYCMPLIRYTLDDEIELSIDNDIIYNIGGRCVDIFDFENSEFNTMFVGEAISEINNIYKDIITEFQYVYHKKTRQFVINIKLSKIDMGLKIVEALEGKIKYFAASRNINGLSFTVYICDHIDHKKNNLIILGDENV